MQTIPFPEEGFEPEQASIHQSPIREFYDRGWEDYQRKNPEACITDAKLVRGLRLAWYNYLEKLDPKEYPREKLRTAGTNWYKAALKRQDWHRPLAS